MECTVCEAAPGDRTRVDFLDSGESVTLPMCDECHRRFADDDQTAARRVLD